MKVNLRTIRNVSFAAMVCLVFAAAPSVHAEQWDAYDSGFPCQIQPNGGDDWAELGGCEFYQTDPCGSDEICDSLCKYVDAFNAGGNIYYCNSNGQQYFWHLTYVYCSCY